MSTTSHDAFTIEQQHALRTATVRLQSTYFGAPGVCFDIDGGWWHEPGR